MDSIKPKVPAGAKVITTVEMHAGGEPLRVITGGLPHIPGETILGKRQYFKEHYDYIRTGLMWEPRGHNDMYGAILTEPVTGDGDLGVFFLHNEGYSTMCGHAIVALTKLVLETGYVRKEGRYPEIRFDTPAGRVTARGHLDENGKVLRSSFLNVPSFTLIREESIDVHGIGRVDFDVAFGGAFYAFVDAMDIGIDPDARKYGQLIDYGMRIKQAVSGNFNIIHPLEPDLGFLYGTIFTGDPYDYHHHSRHVCVFADGQIDRSATGTGVSARASLLLESKELHTGETITIESILGTTMDVSIQSITRVEDYRAVIPEVSGTAWVTGKNEFWLDPDDPLQKGFLLH